MLIQTSCESVVTGDVHTRLPVLLSFVFSYHWFIRELNQAGFGFRWFLIVRQRIGNAANFSVFGRCICRVMFGSSSLYVLHHPEELVKKKKEGTQLEEVTYDLAQEEIAANSGFDMGKSSGQTKST